MRAAFQHSFLRSDSIIFISARHLRLSSDPKIKQHAPRSNSCLGDGKKNPLIHPSVLLTLNCSVCERDGAHSGYVEVEEFTISRQKRFFYVNFRFGSSCASQDCYKRYPSIPKSVGIFSDEGHTGNEIYSSFRLLTSLNH